MPKITGKTKGVMNKEDFAKLPKEQQDKILAKRAENKKKLIAEASNIDLDKIIEDTSTPSDKEFNGKFNKAYAASRKTLVALMKKKRAGLITGQELWQTAQLQIGKIFEFSVEE